MRSVLAVWAAGVLVLAGCSSPDSDWARAQADGSEDALIEFINRHPEAPQAAEARQRVVELRIAADWAAAEESASIAAYEAFLDKHPDSVFRADALEVLQRLRVAAAWSALRDSTDPTQLSAFAEAFDGTPEAEAAQSLIRQLSPPEPEAETVPAPAPAPAPQARPAPAAPEPSGTHRVQLAAFGSSAAAQTGRDQLARQLADVIGDVGLEARQDGGMYRVVTAPLSEARARELCNQIKAQGRECFVRVR